MDVQLEMKIAEMPPEQRPREKALASGVASLNDEELLSLIIAKGSPSFSALEIARNLLSSFGSFESMASAPYPSFKSLKGLGTVKALELAAVYEIAKRIEKQGNVPDVFSPISVFRRYRLSLGPSPIERLYLLSYDKKGNFLQETLLFQGGSLSCGGEEKLILGEVLRRGAASFAIVHNHPSGSALPSREDFAYTASLKIKAEELSLAFLDHLILTRSAFYSFRENGLLR